MVPVKVSSSLVSDVSLNTLKQSVARLFVFLNGARVRAISTALKRGGFSKEQLAEGFALMHAIEHAALSAPFGEDVPTSNPIAACTDFEARELAWARPLVETAYPQQAAFVFRDYVPGKDVAAVFGVSVVLGRLQALENGAARKATRKDDHAAMVIMEQAGVTKELRKALAVAVAEVESTTNELSDEEVSAMAASEAAHLEALGRIHAWLTMWSAVARSLITRRDHLIALGLARRRNGRKPSADVTPVPVPIVVAAPGAPAPGPIAAAPSATAPDGETEAGPSSRAA